MKKIKVGMIGCGGFTKFHLENLKKLEEAEVVAFASTNRERLEKMGGEVPGARLYNDYRDMYEKEKDMRAAIICVPPDSHGDAEILAAGRGIHIYVEKPVALEMEKAVRTEKAIAKSGIIASVGFQERYNDAVLKMKDYLQGRRVGLVHGRWLGGVPGAFWWRRKERSGGQVVEQSIHLFDMLRFFFGEASTVYSTAASGIVAGIPDYNVEDCSATTVRFQNGVIATVHTGCYLEESACGNGIGLQVICSDSVAEYDFYKEARFSTANAEEKYTMRENPHFNALKAFIHAIGQDSGEGIKSDYPDGVKSLRLALAANESMLSGNPVML